MNPNEIQFAPGVFDYRTLRTMVGLIAISLGFLCTLFANLYVDGDFFIPASISVTYFLGAQSVFVGSLFIVAAFLAAYNGHKTDKVNQFYFAKAAAVGAIGVAMFPTSCDGWMTSFLAERELVVADTCSNNVIMGGWVTYVHAASAVVLFGILAWFCFKPFAGKARQKGGLGRRRVIVYQTCGYIMVAAIVIGVVSIVLTDSGSGGYKGRAVFWVELVCLIAFGISWLTAGQQLIPWLIDSKSDVENN
jgi:hypothetical protein